MLHEIQKDQQGRLILPIKIKVAKTFLSRLQGLLVYNSIPRDFGFLLPNTSWIHTWGMRFPIDCVFIDSEGRIVKISSSVPPFRITGVWSSKTLHTLEIPSGLAQELGLKIGDQLKMELTWKYVDNKIS